MLHTLHTFPTSSLTTSLFLLNFIHVAMLDYVSRAHEIEIRPSSVLAAIISVPNARISFQIWLLLPLGDTLERFWMFENFLGDIFVFFKVHGTLWKQNFKTLLFLQIAVESFKLPLNFVPNDPHKIKQFWDFWKFDICFVFITMGPKGNKNFKMLLLLQITARSFETFLEFSTHWAQNYG